MRPARIGEPPSYEKLLELEEKIADLSDIQRYFVELYVLHRDLLQVAKKLGITYKEATKLLSDKNIQQAIDIVSQIISLRNNITIDYFVVNLKEIIDDKNQKTNDRINAMTLLAKILGLLKEKEVNNNQIVVVKQEGLFE
ncbi:MAG: hypothetical protein QXW35_03520 [Candidatus Aenigmatarchaeota archaeon]